MIGGARSYTIDSLGAAINVGQRVCSYDAADLADYTNCGNGCMVFATGVAGNAEGCRTYWNDPANGLDDDDILDTNGNDVSDKFNALVEMGGTCIIYYTDPAGGNCDNDAEYGHNHFILSSDSAFLFQFSGSSDSETSSETATCAYGDMRSAEDGHCTCDDDCNPGLYCNTGYSECKPLTKKKFKGKDAIIRTNMFQMSEPSNQLFNPTFLPVSAGYTYPTLFQLYSNVSAVPSRVYNDIQKNGGDYSGFQDTKCKLEKLPTALQFEMIQTGCKMTLYPFEEFPNTLHTSSLNGMKLSEFNSLRIDYDLEGAADVWVIIYTKLSTSDTGNNADTWYRSSWKINTMFPVGVNKQVLYTQDNIDTVIGLDNGNSRSKIDLPTALSEGGEILAISIHSNSAETTPFTFRLKTVVLNDGSKPMTELTETQQANVFKNVFKTSDNKKKARTEVATVTDLSAFTVDATFRRALAKELKKTNEKVRVKLADMEEKSATNNAMKRLIDAGIEEIDVVAPHGSRTSNTDCTKKDIDASSPTECVHAADNDECLMCDGSDPVALVTLTSAADDTYEYQCYGTSDWDTAVSASQGDTFECTVNSKEYKMGILSLNNDGNVYCVDDQFLDNGVCTDCDAIGEVGYLNENYNRNPNGNLLVSGDTTSTYGSGNNLCNCIEVGQRVLMSDGTHKNIEHLVPGDVLRTPTGITTVRSTRRGARHLSALHDVTCDGKTGALTSEHAYHCDGEWKIPKETHEARALTGNTEIVAVETDNYCEDRMILEGGLEVETWDGRGVNEWRPHTFENGRRLRCTLKGSWRDQVLQRMDSKQ